MAKVCLVIEHWCNEEAYEDCVVDSNVLAVAGNPSTAENIIAGRKKELIDKALDYDSDCSLDGSWSHSENVFDALQLHFSTYDTPFDDEYRIFDKIAFYWEIKNYEIES